MVSLVNIHPQQGHFSSVRIGYPEKLHFRIHNNSSTESITVRIDKPIQSNVFTLLHVPRKKKLVPGLSMDVQVRFCCETEQTYRDQIIVKVWGKSEKSLETISIPLLAEPPKPNMKFNSLIDMGISSTRNTVSKIIEIENHGTKDGHFKFVNSDKQTNVQFEPRTGVVPALTALPIKISFTSTDVGGIQKASASLVMGKEEQSVELFCKVVEPQVSLCQKDGKGIVSSIKFESVYYGQRNIRECILTNNSPFPSTFYVESEEHSSGDENVDRSVAIFAEPNEGQIKPFGEFPITFLFHPEKPKEKIGFESTRKPAHLRNIRFKEELIVTIAETGQKLEIQTEGNALDPYIELSAQKLRFGSCDVQDYRDIMVTLTNQNELPIPFAFSSIAHFSASPSKGLLKGRQSKNVRFTFHPNQLGDFKSKMILSILDGKYKQYISLTGYSEQIGSKESSMKSPKWVTMETLVEKRQNLKQKLCTVKEKRQKHFDTLLKSKGMNQQTEIRHQKENRERYNTFLVTQRQKKGDKNARKKFSALNDNRNDIDMGLTFDAGLIEPIPVVVKALDPLFIPGSSSSVMMGPAKFDENKIIERKFKAAPTTKEEIEECAVRLTSKQLSRIKYGPKEIDFGEMTVFSTAKKSFALYNGLHQHIWVQLATESDEISFYPKSQVIPPNQTAGFDLNFCGKVPKQLQETIFWTINEQNKIKFTALADIVPTNVKLSTDEILFKFDDNSMEKYLTNSLTMTNRGNCDAHFEFSETQEHVQNSEDLFQIHPKHGSIAPGKTVDIQVRFTPGSVHQATFNYLLHVKGAPQDQLIKCIANLPEAKISSVEKKLDFGLMPVGILRTKYVTLKNNGKQAAVFHVEDFHPDLKVSPSIGRIAKGSSQRLLLELKPSVSESYDNPFIISIRGGKRVKINLKGESKAPNVELIDIPLDGLNFGSVYVGGEAQREVKIKNLSDSIPAILYLDFTKHYDYFLKDANGDRITLDTPENSAITIASNVKEEESDSDSEASEEDDNISDVGSEFMEGDKYQIAIPFNSVLSFQVVFKPTVVEDHAFDFPLELAGITSNDSLQFKCKAVALKPRLVISNSCNFKSRVVFKEGVAMLPHRQIVTLSNEDEQELYWEFDEEVLNSMSTIFKVEPPEGKLLRGHQVQVQVFFTPKELRSYQLNVPVYLDKNRAKSYTTFTIKGVGANPKLEFDVQEVVLPIVPLGVKSTGLFQIINQGYTNLDLKFRLPADTVKIPISLNFIEGKKLSTEKQALPVEVTFVSKVPMSFTARIDFYDDDNNRFSVPVTCTTDNCLLTTYPYLVYNKDSFVIHAESMKHPIMLAQRDEDVDDFESDKASVGYTASVYSTYTSSSSKLSANTRGLRKVFSRRSTKRLLKWINVNVLDNPVDDLIKSLVHSNGSILFDIIQTLSGKKAPGKISKLPNNRKETSNALKQQYEKVLTFLKSYGALLNHVKPHFLLKYNEYRSVLDPKSGEKKVSEQAFKYQSCAAWLSILYQILKIFYLNRITLKSFRSLPGLQPELSQSNDSTLSGSNIMSLAENILLKWVSFHYNQIHQSNERFINFGKPFSNSLAIAALLQSHVPSLENHFSKLKTSFKSSGDYEKNANLIVDALQIIRLDYPLHSHDILQGNPRDMLLFIMYLYHNLPQYIPKAEITFVGNLQQTIEKHIELSNPTKHQIEYTCELDTGTDTNDPRSEEFSISDKHVVLEPKSRIKYAVSATPRFSEPGGGRLTFFAKSSGCIKPASLVFQLKTKCIVNQYSKSLQMESRVYEVAQLAIDVDNIFDQTGLFKITCDQSNNCRDKQKKFLPDPFWFTSDHINIKANDKKTLMLNFLPFAEGITYNCRLKFSDPKVGEFIYSVTGSATDPLPQVKPLKIGCESNEEHSFDLAWTPVNQIAERAYQTLQERNKKYRFTCNDSTKIPEDIHGPITYHVSFSNRYFIGETKVTIDKNTKSPKIPITFRPRKPGIYPCQIKFISDYDYRIFEVEGTARSPGVEVELKFNVPVRKRVTQHIPLTNSSEVPWKIKCEFSGSEYFSGPKELRIGAGNTENYPLEFYPLQMGSCDAELVLTNPETLEKYVYKLSGDVDEPIAHDKIVINCNARDTVEYDIEVPNLNQDKMINYHVDIDLGFVQGEELCTVTGKNALYPISVSPTLGGQHHGAITFTSKETGEHVWFVLEINAERAPPERVLEISSIVRESSVAIITISNPSESSLTFDVLRQGKGLVGDDMVTLEGKESIEYELIYCPLLAEQTNGVLSFYNESVGEFWYDLSLIAKPAPPIELPVLTCEIGKQVEHKIKIENPLDQPVTLTTSVSNTRNFKIEKDVTLFPYETNIITLEYYPSSIDQQEECNIVLQNSLAGEWIYEAIGMGTPPTDMDPIIIYSKVDHSDSEIVTFKNPFPERKQFRIHVEFDESGGPTNVFAVLTKKKHEVLKPFGSLHIPFTFSPPVIGQFTCFIIVVCDELNLQWRFPIIGITEVWNREHSYSFSCKARENITKTISVPLKGLFIDDLTSGDFDFTHDFVFSEKNKYAKAMKLSLVLNPTEPEHQTNQQLYDHPVLHFSAEYGPLRPFEGSAELHVRKVNGGIWKFDIHFQSSVPEIDDTIEIQSSMGKTTHVSFRLNNIFGHHAPFEAYFTPESPLDFRVEPEKGMLRARGVEGTQFLVSYTANKYGKDAIGTLVIDTDRMQWRYKLKGILPKTRRNDVESKINTKLKGETMEALARAQRKRKSNILKRNIMSCQTNRSTRKRP